MRWYILRVKNRKIPKVMEAIGHDVCWRPCELRWTKPARKKKAIQVEVPLIPGWVFVQEDQYGRHLELDGVFGALKYGRLGPVWIEDEDLNGLRSACIAPFLEPQEQQDAEVEVLAVGDPVMLKGLFYGRLGVVERILPGTLVRVRAAGLPIDLDVKLVERVENT